MKYMCKTCKTACDDITEHMLNVHKFSKSIMKLQLKTNQKKLTYHRNHIDTFWCRFCRCDYDVLR